MKVRTSTGIIARRAVSDLVAWVGNILVYDQQKANILAETVWGGLPNSFSAPDTMLSDNLFELGEAFWLMVLSRIENGLEWVL